MFTIIPNQAIDRSRWDELVSSCPTALIYGHSWFLDAVAPGWKVIVDKEYQLGLPLVTNQKFGQPYIYQPLFGQKFSLYFRDRCSVEHADALWKSIPETYRYIEIQVNVGKVHVPKKFDTELRTNQILALKQSYPEMNKNYKKGLLYSIRKAAQTGVIIRKDISEIQFEKFLIASELYEDFPLYRNNHDAFMRLMKTADSRASGTRWGAFLPDGELLSVAYSLEDKTRVYYLLQCSTENGRSHCAAHALTDTMIRGYAGKAKLFDFVGSNIPSIAFFNNQFGAEPEFYQKISHGSRSISHCLWQTVKSAVSG